jgi:hypothetical protein
MSDDWARAKKEAEARIALLEKAVSEPFDTETRARIVTRYIEFILYSEENARAAERGVIGTAVAAQSLAYNYKQLCERVDALIGSRRRSELLGTDQNIDEFLRGEKYLAEGHFLH